MTAFETIRDVAKRSSMLRAMVRAARILNRELYLWFDHLVFHWPGELGFSLREWLIRRRARQAGKPLVIGQGVTITGYENLILGNNVRVMTGSQLYAHDGFLLMGDNISIERHVQVGACDDGARIIMGNNVSIGPNVVLRAADHRFDSPDVPIRDQGHVGGSIVIEDDVWIAANCVVLRDVRLGSHSVIAAGSVVKKDVEPYSVVAGVPAKVVRWRIPAPDQSAANAQENGNESESDRRES
jgi:galactoside O-acetyltransferase